MALLRIGSFDFRFGPKRVPRLTNYDDKEPYMPGGRADAQEDEGDYGDYEGGYDDDR